jgi:hypothetical protein
MSGSLKFSLFLSLIRALFPRWNFFDRVGHQFGVEFKTTRDSAWIPVHFERPRTGFALFLNADFNMALAQVNVVEHFAQDVQELPLQNTLHNKTLDSRLVRNLTSFKLLLSLLEVKQQELGIQSNTIQFKITATNLSNQLDIYVSDWVKLNEGPP